MNEDNKNYDEKKVAVIVGGSSGIGLATAKRLISNGWTVYNISRSDCPEQGVCNISADVSDFAQTENAFASIADDIDALIYSAGFSMAAPVEYASEEDYKYLFDVNFFGFIKAVQCALPRMKYGGGKIIAVSSLGGVVPILYDAFYSASKAALDMLVKGCASELKKYHISVTAVQPGGTRTEFTAKRKVYPTADAGDYAADMKAAVLSLAEMEQGGMSPKAVAEVICDVMSKTNPPLSVACGAKNKTLKLCSKVLPDKLVLKFNDMTYRRQ